MNEFAKYLTHTFLSCRARTILTIIAALGMGLGCLSAVSQSGAGSIQGIVTDSTGAVIPAASIHVVNQATGISSDTKSNDVGFYQVPSLFTGTYAIAISATGMKTNVQIIDLLVAQNATINATLHPGAVSERVQVSADAVQLTTTDNGTINTTLENARINQLPLNGRVLTQLVSNTTPAVESAGQKANGLMMAALEYVADGALMTNREFGGENQTQATVPDPDAIQEVQIQTSNTSAQYSAPATALITTKSGTNDLHGSAFETLRNNSVLGNARARSISYVLPKLVRNEFGVSAGGPIVLPELYHGKDKSFWFFAYERYSRVQSTPGNVTVPSVAMRKGDFSGLLNASGQLQQLYDPSTTASSANCNGTGTANLWCRTPFTNNQIPTGSQSPTDKILNAILPLPATTANPLITANLSAPNFTYMVVPTETFRLDHEFNETNRAYLRFTSDNQSDLYAQSASIPPTIAADGIAANASGVISLPNQTIGAAIGYSHVFSTTFFSETVLSAQWENSLFSEPGSGIGAPDYEKLLGLPNNFGESGIPGISGGVATYQTSQGAYGLINNIFNVDENMTKTIGRNQMQFGGRLRHERNFNYNHTSNDTVSFGSYATGLELPSSGGNYSATSNTGAADGDMYLGGASQYQVQLQPVNIHTHLNSYAAYFQDNYHVSRTLTVNIGLRWEAHLAPWVKNGLMNSFDLKNDAQVLSVPISTLVSEGYTSAQIATNLQNLGVTFETPQQAGLPTSLTNNYPLEFAPRLGLAYQPFAGKFGTVIRGAYGRYLYPIPTRNTFFNNVAINAPFYAAYTESYIAANQSPDGLANYLLRAPQSVVMGVNSANVINTTTTNAILPGITNWSVSPDYAPETVTEANFTIEQPFKGNSVLRVSWVWSHGSNLDDAYYYNTHPSQFVWEMQTGTTLPTGTYTSTATGPYDKTIYSGSSEWQQMDGWSNDNALQVNYQRIFHHGIAYQVVYAWSSAFRVGGNSSSDSQVYTAQSYLGALGVAGTMTSPYGTVITPSLPPARPAGIAPYADWHALNVWEEYQRDTGIPMHHVQFNGIVDLPFGQGKRFFGNSSRLLDEMIGGFQLAGDGNIVSQNFRPTATNWGPTNPIQVYKHKAPITDCRSGTCYKEYEWFNGYIAPTAASGFVGSCTLASSNVTGLPSNWTPYQSPIDTDCNPKDTAYKYYGQNEVQVTAPTLNGGLPLDNPYSPGTVGDNPYSHTVIKGPFNWTMDLSVFKVFPITEKMNLRFNLDAFNALNVQGYNNPNAGDGTESLTSSYNTPRQLQLSARLTF